ncbi:MAG: hypothetical protein EP338_11195 [Bacteroidetes bacterium]|nr:MAG: hypothetical protein EP338_11195 [Bacteroidota bacterium]
MYRNLLIVFLLCTTCHCFAQDSLVQFINHFPDSLLKENPRKVSQYCFTINAKRSIDPLNPELIFKWFMRDQVRTGTEVEFCVNGPGSYPVVLRVSDAESKLAIRKEDSTFMVEIPEVEYFNLMRKNQIADINKLRIYHSYDLIYSGLDTSEIIYWKIDASPAQKGNKLKFIFDEMGQVKIRCFIFDRHKKLKYAYYEKVQVGSAQ